MQRRTKVVRMYASSPSSWRRRRPRVPTTSHGSKSAWTRTEFGSTRCLVDDRCRPGQAPSRRRALPAAPHVTSASTSGCRSACADPPSSSEPRLPTSDHREEHRASTASTIPAARTSPRLAFSSRTDDPPRTPQLHPGQELGENVRRVVRRHDQRVDVEGAEAREQHAQPLLVRCPARLDLAPSGGGTRRSAACCAGHGGGATMPSTSGKL